MNLIVDKTQWLRSIKRGETKTGRVEKPKDCSTMSVLIYRWNLEEGRSRGIRITAKYDRLNCLVTITGMTIDLTNDLTPNTRHYVDES